MGIVLSIGIQAVLPKMHIEWLIEPASLSVR